MPIIALQLKANLVNVTNLQPSDYLNHRWYFKLKCSGCNETTNRWQYAIVSESYSLTKGHGICHINAKCSFCSRHNSLEILPDSYSPYIIEKNDEFQTIVKFDCRGIEPVDYDLRIGWKCEGIESGMLFDNIDLNDKEWADYDEKVQKPVEINEIEYQFVISKK